MDVMVLVCQGLACAVPNNAAFIAKIAHFTTERHSWTYRIGTPIVDVVAKTKFGMHFKC